MKFYFFEVENHIDLISGNATGGKPQLRERGPYTYRELLSYLILSYLTPTGRTGRSGSSAGRTSGESICSLGNTRNTHSFLMRAARVVSQQIQV